MSYLRNVNESPISVGNMITSRDRAKPEKLTEIYQWSKATQERAERERCPVHTTRLLQAVAHESLQDDTEEGVGLYIVVTAWCEVCTPGVMS